MRVTVTVWINRPLEPGDELIGTAVDLVGATCVALPARYANRQDRGPRGDATKGRRADDDPRQLRSVALELAAIVGIGRGVRPRIAAHHVQPSRTSVFALA